MNKSDAYLIGYTNCTEEVCAASGRISTQSGTATEIFEKSHDEEKNRKLIDRVTKSGHTSTIEHMFFNFAFENVSVVVEQFMIEFRLASFTVKSRRYVDFSDSGSFLPEFSNKQAEKLFRENAEYMFSVYGKLIDSGIPKEDARFVLPYCFFSNFFCSMNGRELINILRAMIYGRGNKIKEIHDIGINMLNQCREVAPGIFSDFESRSEKYNDLADLSFLPDVKADDESEPNVEVISFTENGEKTVATAALIEYGNYSAKEIESILGDDTITKKIISALCKSERPRALESFDVTVRFNHVSLACITHFARHRIQSICIPSLLTCKRDSYIIPPTVKENEDLLNLYIDAYNRNTALYEKLKEMNCDESQLIYTVLSGNTLDIVTTMNARQLQLFFKLRSCTRAQWEIQIYATELLLNLRKACPDIFVHFGPSCYATGVCPEGRLSCGRSSEIKEKFSKL